MNNNDIWVAAIARGHNSGVCLLKNGDIVFSIEEERLSRHKYDGGPFASMIKILEYTDKIDYLVIAHTQNLKDTAGRVDFTGDDVYTGLARKLGLIDRKANIYDHPQVIDLSHMHHKLHAACAFYNSGFETATAVVIDGAGTFIPLQVGKDQVIGWETETLFSCEYPAKFSTVYKHIGTRGPTPTACMTVTEDQNEYVALVTENAGITKVYEAVTEYCGFSSIEAGKTMGLFPYGKLDETIPELFVDTDNGSLSNRNVIIPNYPNGAIVNQGCSKTLVNFDTETEITQQENRRNLAWKCQTDTQRQAANLIRKAVKMTGNTNVVLSGGYGLNCVANYYYLQELKDEGINLYVEPVSNDAGTAMGAAMLVYRDLSSNSTVKPQSDTVYLGPLYTYTLDDIDKKATEYGALIEHASYDTLVDLITSKNIVAVFQGRSENGPRALGNRSLVFDPTFADGKDFVNSVKRREYFRPFAGSILEEDVHEWFDLRGMESSPTMMYAVNCKPGIAEKIPSIIHVDGTCRIQTVNEKQNPHYYNIIKAFKQRTGVPIVFNTSFNLGGEPLVETLDDALWTLKQSEIEYLFLPEHGKLLSIKN